MDIAKLQACRLPSACGQKQINGANPEGWRNAKSDEHNCARDRSIARHRQGNGLSIGQRRRVCSRSLRKIPERRGRTRRRHQEQRRKSRLRGADLAAAGAAAEIAGKVRSFVGDRLDVLVANAGISKAARIEDHTVEDFDNLFATNVRAPFFLVQQLLPTLGEGSSIIVTTSLAARVSPGAPGQTGAPSLPDYAATKGALETLVRHWASMLGTRGIRVNAVAPGVIETDLSNFTKSEAGRSITLNMQSLKRIGKPEDVADVIAFLASDGARWITGVSIPVDGGSKL